MPSLPDDKPSRPCRTLFGVSCYRQISAQVTDSISFTAKACPRERRDLKRKCSKGSRRPKLPGYKPVSSHHFQPFYGSIEARLKAATQAYFEQANFQNREILQGIFDLLNGTLFRSSQDLLDSNLHMGESLDQTDSTRVISD